MARNGKKNETGKKAFVIAESAIQNLHDYEYSSEQKRYLKGLMIRAMLEFGEEIKTALLGNLKKCSTPIAQGLENRSEEYVSLPVVFQVLDEL
jgi:hypothetical protein